MVGEARVYVQGASLKARAALLTEAFQLPDHQGGGGHAYAFAGCGAVWSVSLRR
jgi:hypothetical protein